MEDLILIKLGGSLITDKAKPFCAEEVIIQRLGREISEAQKKFSGKIIIGHGSGSFGHTVAAKYKTQEGIVKKEDVYGLALVADAAIQINRIVIKNFLKLGISAVSLSPVSFLTAKGKKLDKFFLGPILQTLSIGLTPVVYGDVILDSKRGCCIFSCEKVLAILAGKLSGKFRVRVIHCGNTDGVYDEKGKTIPVITPASWKRFQKAIGGSGATDVTGGMLHKVEESLTLARLGIDSLIINGSMPGELERAILGNKGTVVTAR